MVGKTQASMAWPETGALQTGICDHRNIDLEWLREAYRLTRKDGAPGRYRLMTSSSVCPAKAKGTRFGPKPKLTAHQQAEALKRLAAGESCRSIARTMAVHHATVARLAIV